MTVELPRGAARAAAAILREAPVPHRYAGMSHKQASQLGLRLCRAAATTGYWRHLPDHLALLRDRLDPIEEATGD